jgi:hypothetical protein
MPNLPIGVIDYRIKERHHTEQGMIFAIEESKINRFINVYPLLDHPTPKWTIA